MRIAIVLLLGIWQVVHTGTSGPHKPAFPECAKAGARVIDGTVMWTDITDCDSATAWIEWVGCSWKGFVPVTPILLKGGAVRVIPPKKPDCATGYRVWMRSTPFFPGVRLPIPKGLQ